MRVNWWHWAGCAVSLRETRQEKAGRTMEVCDGREGGGLRFCPPYAARDVGGEWRGEGLLFCGPPCSPGGEDFCRERRESVIGVHGVGRWREGKGGKSVEGHWYVI